MTVYEMIQELAKYPPDSEVQFDCTMRIDGHAGMAVPEPSGNGIWVEDFEFDDLLGLETIKEEDLLIDGVGERRCPLIKLKY